MNRQSMIIQKHSSVFLIIRIIGFQGAYVRIQLRKKEAALSDLDYLVGLGVSKVALKEFYDKLKKIDLNNNKIKITH